MKDSGLDKEQIGAKTTYVPANEEVAHCPVCGEKAKSLLHGSVQDLVFHTPGTWNICKCRACESFYLNPRTVFADISKIYLGYPEHHKQKQSNLWAEIQGRSGHSRKSIIKGWKRDLKNGILCSRLGYAPVVTPSPVFYLGKIFAKVWGGSLDRLLSSVMFLPFKKNGRVLDVGCGSGGLLYDLRSFGWVPEGLDWDPAAEAMASKLNVPFRQGALWDQGYPDHFFDAVTMKHVIEHEYDPGKLLRECFRVLKPGGLLSLLTPNTKSLGHAMFGPNWRGLEPPRHVQIFSQKALEGLITKCGFTVLRSWTSARCARFMWKQSLRLREGKTSGKMSRVREWLFYFQESIPGSDLGEEICLLAEKER